ncbi:MAG TPA: ABC transporter ATP-binding protein, partial [Acidimicrobiia bacterium]|nr:ABC transporter ATP-binding protein [Acidimicrobiia bacterium]
MEPVVVSEGLTKSFTPEAGVFDLDLLIPPGKIVGFIGPSGSGKTTTVRLLTGLLRPDRGSISVLGEIPTEFDANTRARLGYMPQQAILYPDLTLTQNLRFAASLYGLGRRVRGRLGELTEFLDLDEAMDRLPTQASGGEQRRL